VAAISPEDHARAFMADFDQYLAAGPPDRARDGVC
jgi:hypothetical protein